MSFNLKKVSLPILSVALFPSHAAFSAPMDPSEKNLTAQFSVQVQSDFLLLADSEDNSLVYYVPARGGVAIEARNSTNPLPQFAISNFMPSFGFFAGESLVRMGGALSTSSYMDSLKLLEAEASSKGFHIAPAPAASATTKFLLGAYELSNGRLDVNCTQESIIITKQDGSTKTVKIPKCATKSDPTSTYDLDLNVMYKFTSLPALGNSVVSQTIPFQAVTLPGTEAALRLKMQTGAQWNDYMTARVDWEITSQRKTRQARFHINWESAFEQASAFAAYHNNSCVDIEVNGFFQKLAQCSQENECGIRVEYMQNNGEWGAKAPDNSAFINATNEIKKSLTSDLFTEVQNKTKSELGRVSQNASSQFTLRANYEKIAFSKNEVIPFTYNEGPASVKASTTLNISCLKGGFEDGRVGWNMEDAGCKSIIGQ